MHWIELLTVTTGRTTDTTSNAHVGKVSSVMYGYLMFSSWQKKPRLNGGMTSPKNALTRPTMRKHAKSTTWENFPEDILLVALVVTGPKLNTWDYEMNVVWRWSPTQILLRTCVWWVILTNKRTNTSGCVRLHSSSGGGGRKAYDKLEELLCGGRYLSPFETEFPRLFALINQLH